MGDQTSDGRSAGGDVLLSVRDVQKRFAARRGLLRPASLTINAVEGVSFDLRQGTTLAIVGESGGGKTTVGRMLAGLEEPTGGGVYAVGLFGEDEPDVDRFGRTPVHELSRVDRQRFHRRCQFVTQFSAGSLNPRHTVREILGRPLKKLGGAMTPDLETQLSTVVRRVGLEPSHLDNLPEFFSSGQLQRISIARALALEPKVLVMDEPTAPIDVSSQAHILNLLVDIQRQLGLTCVIITHDLAVARHMADDLVVMQSGRVVDSGPVATALGEPNHPYTRKLIDSDLFLPNEPDGIPEM